MSLLRDLWLLIRAYPASKRAVTKKRDTRYPGVVLTQIAYQEARTELVHKGYKDDDITGAVIYIAVSAAYLFNRK